MISIIIDDILFEVWGDRTLWLHSEQFVEAPADWAQIARALVCCDYEDRAGHTYLADRQVFAPADGVAVHFPLSAGMPPIRATNVVTGTYQGEKIISILAWDDPIDQVMTTGEMTEVFNISDTTAKKAIPRRLFAKKKGKVWVARKWDAVKLFG